MKIETNILVAGFPKSGTVWLTMMIGSIIEGRHLTKKQTGEITQEVHDTPRKFTKTHKTDLQDIEYNKAVYIIRDPRAVINSAICHWGEKETKNLDNILKNMHYKRFIILENILRYFGIFNNFLMDKFLRGFNLKKHHVLNWDEHIYKWENVEKVLIIRYEDLLKSTFKEMFKICEWLGLDINDENLKKYIEYYRFKNVKNREKSTSHFRRGIEDSWIKELDYKIVKEIEKRYKLTMERYDYFLLKKQENVIQREIGNND